ncbi:MAG: hypothetical protein ACRD2W_20950 [Acidimicrobiales bacterium]
MTSGQGGPQDISERVARGFEALVESEQATVASGRPAGGAAGAGAGAALEERVRQTMEALTELVQAQIPVAVDGLRDELETMRVDLQSSLNQATGDLAQERQELRAQIAKTVGAANKWFVKARDQLIERLDQVAAVAAEASARADEAANAAATAATAAESASAAAPAKPVELIKLDRTGQDGDEVLEWDVEDDQGSAPARGMTATVDLAVDGAELDALMEPVRGDIQELQGEISAMGQAVAELRAEVAALTKRVPARPKPVRLDERDIDVIIEAVLVAMTPPARSSPLKKAAAKRSLRT